MAAYLMLEGLGMIRGWLRNLHAALLMRDNSVRAWQPLRQFFRPGEGFPLPGDSGSMGYTPVPSAL